MIIGSIVFGEGIISYDEFVAAIAEHELMTGYDDLSDYLYMSADMLHRIQFGKGIFGASQEGSVVTVHTDDARYTITIDHTLDSDVIEFRTEDC